MIANMEKPSLKSKITKVIQVDDWDDFVLQVYGKPYCFQQQDGCKSRGVETFTVPCKWVDDYEETEIPFEVNGEKMGVSFETWLNTSPEDTALHFNPEYKFENQLFWERNFYPNVDMIVNDLYAKGLLEAGEYLIVIDW